jgi:hypothetical protein
MKRKAFLALGVLLVFAILAIPRSISAIGTQGAIAEIICIIENTVKKLAEQLPSFVLKY